MSTMTHDGAVNERRSFPRRAHDRAPERATAVVRDIDGVRVSWGGIWGGVLVAMGVLLLLTSLGLAIGISAVDPYTSEAQPVGIGAAVWGAISLLLSLYVGGMVATRVGVTIDRTTGMVEGALVWVLSVLLVAYLAGSGIGLLASGAFKLVGGATQAIGSMVTGSSPDLSQGNVDQIVQRLRDPQTARTLAAATGMSEDEIRTNLAQIADKAEAARADPAQAAVGVRQGVQDMIQQARSEGRLEQAAERAQGAATKAAWMTFAALLLSLLASVLGALSGRRAVPVRVAHA